MKRCNFCRNEIHTSRDGHEIDHEAWCEQFKIQTAFVYDEEKDQFFIFHPDDPARPYHPITLPAVIHLARLIRVWEQDWQNENYPTLR